MEENNTLREHTEGILAFADRLASEWEEHVVPQVREALDSSQEAGIYTALEPAINSIRSVLWSILEPEQSGSTENILDVGAFLDASSQATLVLEVATAQQERLVGFKDKWENLLDQCDAAKAKLDQRQAEIIQRQNDTRAQLVIVRRRMQNVDSKLRVNRIKISESRLARPMAVGREVVARLPVVGSAVRQVVKAAIDGIVGPNPLEQEREGLILQNHQNDFDITQLRGQLDHQHRARTELVELESATEQLRRPDGRLGVVLTEFYKLSQRLNEECNSLSIRVSQIKGHIEDLIVTATESNGGEIIIVKAVEDLLRNMQRRDNKFYTMLDGAEDMVKRIRENQLNEESRTEAERRRVEEHAEHYSRPSHASRRVSPPPSAAISCSRTVWSDHGYSASDSESVRSTDTIEDLLDFEESPEVTITDAPLIDFSGEENPPQNPSEIELLNGLEISPGEGPPLIDLESDPQTNDITRAPSRSLGLFSGAGGLLNIQPSRAHPLLDGDTTEDLSVPLEPDGSSPPSPQRSPNLNLRPVRESPQMTHTNESQFQEPLPDLQDDSQATSIHGEDSAKSIVEDVAYGIDSENTDEATEEPLPNEASNAQIPIIRIEVIDKPPPSPPSITSTEENQSGEGDADSDIFEDAPQTPSDIVDILGEQEARKLEDEHLGEHHPSVTSVSV